jgi:hypothetical protein
MTGRSRRLPAGIVLAFLVAALALAATAGAVQADTSPLSIKVQFGYHNAIRLGQWMPVTIDLINDGPALDGTLEVQVASSGQPGMYGFSGSAVYDMPISLAAGAAKHIRTYLVQDNPGSTINVRIVQDRRVVVSEDAPNPTIATVLIGVASDRPRAFDDFAALHPGGISATVVHLALEDIADSALVLRGFNMLAVDDFATDSLTAGQRTAIADYVQNGGSLFVGTGASWRKTLAGLPPGILPMRISGSTTLASSPALGGLSGIEVATGMLIGGHAWLSEGDRPLLVERTVGSGSVTMATFDWNQEPISGWGGTGPLLRQSLVRTVYGNQSDQFSPIGKGMPFGSQGASVSQRSAALTGALGNMPALDLPSLALIGALLFIYVLLVGPVNYLVLGSIHRRALAWITVPLIAIVAVGGAYGVGVFNKGRSAQTNQVSMLHLQPGWDRAYQETYAGVLVPTRGDYVVNIVGNRRLISPISANSGQPFPNSSRNAIRVNLSSDAIALPAMTAFTLRGFVVEGLTAAPHLTASLQLVNGKLTGTIHNLSSITFTDEVVIAGDSYQKLDSLAPGASAAVSLTPKLANLNAGPPAIPTIYSNYQYGPRPGQATAAEREAAAKAQVLALLPGGGFRGLNSSPVPVVVAWTKEPIEDVTMNGSHPNSSAVTAVLLTVPVDQIGVGPLPVGVVTGRIVDLEGDTQQGPPGGIMLSNGTATYEFAPPLAAGTALAGASFTASNPYGSQGFPGAANGAAAIRGEVWDWSHSAWIDVAYKDNASTSVPDAAIDPSTAMVRLRITVTNAGFIPSLISLAGTVQ